LMGLRNDHPSTRPRSPDRSWRWIQGMYWRPDPIGPPTPNRNAGSICASAPPSRPAQRPYAESQPADRNPRPIVRSLPSPGTTAQENLCRPATTRGEPHRHDRRSSRPRSRNQRLRTGLCFRNRSYQLLGQLHRLSTSARRRASVQRPPMIASPARFTTASLRSRACLRP